MAPSDAAALRASSWTRIEASRSQSTHTITLRYVRFDFPWKTVVDFPVGPEGVRILHRAVEVASP